MLGNVAGTLIDPHDGIANLVFSKFAKDVGPVFEHGLNNMRSFIESGVRNFL